MDAGRLLLGACACLLGAGGGLAIDLLARRNSESVALIGGGGQARQQLLAGQVRLNQLTPEGHQVTIRYMGPGESMGVIVVLSEMAYPLSAEAVTDALALGWDAQTISHLMEQHSRLALNGMRMVAGRFRDYPVSAFNHTGVRLVRVP